MAEIKIGAKLTADGSQFQKEFSATQATMNKFAKNIVELGLKVDEAFSKGLSTDDQNKALSDYNKEVERFREGLDRIGVSAETAKKAGGALQAQLESISKSMSSLNLKGVGNASGSRGYDFISSLRDGLSGEDVKNASNAVNSVGSSFKNAAVQIDKAEKSVGGFGAKFVSTVKNILIFRTVMNITNGILNKFKETIRESIQAAAEAEQVYSKLNTVFGKYSDAMSESIILSQKLGISATTAASALSTVGDLLQAQGATTTDSLKLATEWVEQFNDIIAFKDIDMSLEEFAQNFMSGAAGNLRNFRTFGSIVKESAVQSRLAAQGLDQLTGSELELAKMTARAEIALEQQKNAMGATEREWDTLLSIQRRYNEAWKQWKENFGEDLARDVSKIKAVVTGLLSDVNKVNAARKQIEAGEANVGVWDIHGKSDDWKEFSESVADYANNYGQLIMVIKEFDATYEDVVKAIEEQGVSMDDITIADNFKRLREEAKAIQKERAFQKWLKDTGAELTNLAQQTDSFVDSLGSLKGINMSSNWEEFLSGVTITEGNAEKISKLISGDIASSIQMAIDQLSNTGTEGYSSIADVVFGDEAVQDGYKAWLGEVEDLYVILYNRMLKFGDVSQDQLNAVKKIWDDISADAKAYNDELARQQRVNDAIQNGVTGGKYGQSIAEFKYMDMLAKNKYPDFVSKWDTLNNPEWNDGEMEALAALLSQYEPLFRGASEDEKRGLQNSLSEEIADIFEYAFLNYEKSRKANAQSALTSYGQSVSDLQFQNSIFGMSELDKAIAENNRSVEQMIETYKLNSEEADKAKESAEQYNDALRQNAYLEEQKAKQEEQDSMMEQINEILGGIKENFISMFGEGGAIYSALKLIGSDNGVDRANGWAGLADFGMSILAQTEAMEKINSVISDIIVPVLDAFLEPLLPLIDMVVGILQEGLMAFLDWFYPIFNTLCAGVAEALGVIKGIFTFIQEGIKWMIGSLVKAIFDAIDLIPGVGNYTPEWAKKWADLDPWNDMLAEFRKGNETAQKILGQSFEINKNTKKNDYGTYAQLMRDKYITPEQYAQLIGPNKYSSATTTNGVTMTKSGYGSVTYVTYNGLTVMTDNPEKFEEYYTKRINGTVSYANL